MTVHISVVIPVYKAEECLEVLYDRLTKSLQSITPNYEIIFVEDCGGDHSWEIICGLAERDNRVKGIQFSRNFGQHYGITAGLDFSEGEWIVVMDCDLQDRPEEIPRLYAKAQEGYDLVLAIRKHRKSAWYKLFASYFFYLTFNYFANLSYDYRIGNFRIMSRRVVNYFCMSRECHRSLGHLTEWMGFPYTTIDILHDHRYSGRSTYTFSRLWKMSIDNLINYSDAPLRLAVKLGLFISIFSLGCGIYIFYTAITTAQYVIGWSSLIVSLYFLGGVIIMFLGITGIYIGKIYDEVKRRPLYVIRNTTPNCDIKYTSTRSN